MRLVALKIITLRGQFKADFLETRIKDTQWINIRITVIQGDKQIDQNLAVESELLLYKNKWFILNEPDIKKRILHDNYDSMTSSQATSACTSRP